MKSTDGPLNEVSPEKDADLLKRLYENAACQVKDYSIITHNLIEGINDAICVLERIRNHAIESVDELNTSRLRSRCGYARYDPCFKHDLCWAFGKEVNPREPAGYPLCKDKNCPIIHPSLLNKEEDDGIS